MTDKIMREPTALEIWRFRDACKTLAMIPCIVGRCPLQHRGSDKCNGVLGCCGAEITLEQSRVPGGYAVLTGNNPILDALKRRGLVRVRPVGYGQGVVFAK